MLTGYWLLACHLVGDYLFQTDWMATRKTDGSLPAACHALTYTVPFAFLFGFQWEPLLLIGGSHFVIDRWRLARYFCWAKNQCSPASTVTFVSHPNGPWHKQGAALGCTVDEQGIYTCTHHPELRARRVEVQWRHPWSECKATGYHRDKPLWLTVWLLIIADNTIHLLINGLAWELWGK